MENDKRLELAYMCVIAPAVMTHIPPPQNIEESNAFINCLLSLAAGSLLTMDAATGEIDDHTIEQAIGGMERLDAVVKSAREAILAHAIHRSN